MSRANPDLRDYSGKKAGWKSSTSPFPLVVSFFNPYPKADLTLFSGHYLQFSLEGGADAVDSRFVLILKEMFFRQNRPQSGTF